MVVTNQYRTLWLSDIHLGTSESRASDLLEFLGQVAAERIYLVGDIVDLQRLHLRPVFPDIHRQVVSRLLRLAATGTDVCYIPGNHDREFRNLAGRDICGAKMRLEAVHETATGKRFLVTHGDVLDAEIRRNTNLQQFGAAGYRLLMQLDVAVNSLRSKLGQDYFPISANIKQRIGSAQKYIRRFEATAATYAAGRGFDGIICGHIHRPAIRTIDGVLYANDGDWVEHRTAIAEDSAGKLLLLRWHSDGIGAADERGKESIAA